MPARTPPHRLRQGVFVALLAPPTLIVLLAPGQAQPPGGIRGGGATGIPGGGITGRPGGISGLPGGMSGRPGGITGLPGSGIPEMPRPPVLPPIGRLPRHPSAPGATSTSYYCGRCNTHLGDGMIGAMRMICPNCGAHFDGTVTEVPGNPGTQPPGGRPPSATPPGSGEASEQPRDVPPPQDPPQTYTPPPSTPPSTPVSEAPAQTVNWSRAGLLVGALAVFGVLCVAALILAVFVYKSMQKPQRRLRRNR